MADSQTVTLSGEELLELERILLDDDAPAALAFLRQSIWRKVKASRRKLINPKQGTGALD